MVHRYVPVVTLNCVIKIIALLHADKNVVFADSNAAAAGDKNEFNRLGDHQHIRSRVTINQNSV